MPEITRRAWLKAASALAASQVLPSAARAAAASSPDLPHARPAKSQRHFTSTAVEALILDLQRRMADPALAVMFENCYPNTLDTTVFPGTFERKPDTYVVTGDIDAMWLRDSSAQVWPYLPLAKDDAPSRLFEGVIRRQARMILIDPYANAFMRNPPTHRSVGRSTTGPPPPRRGERKWEVDSLCYPIRLAHGYWQQTGDTRPFDANGNNPPGPSSVPSASSSASKARAPTNSSALARPDDHCLRAASATRPSLRHDLLHVSPLGRCLHLSAFGPANLFAVVSLRKLRSSPPSAPRHQARPGG